MSRIFDDGACPYFWPIGPQDDPAARRHILIHYSHTSGGKFLLGQYDTQEKKFYAGYGGKFNHGASWPCGVHAPSFTPDGHGGLVGIFNMNHGQRTPGWTQIMSLPYLVTLLNPNEIGIQPHPSLECLRREHVEKQKCHACRQPGNRLRRRPRQIDGVPLRARPDKKLRRWR